MTMPIETRYVVVHRDDDPLAQGEFFGQRGDAVAYRDRLGGGARVYVAEPLAESGHWDWAVDHGTDYGPMEYVSERAARACLGGGTLLRRRAGSGAWEKVATDEGVAR